MNQRRQRRFVPDRLAARGQRPRQGQEPRSDQQGGKRPQPPPAGPEERPWPPPKELARFETPGERRRRLLVGVVLLLVGLVLALLAWSGSSLARSYHGAPAHSESATQAVVRGCDRDGPVSRAGFGYWWECTADVEGQSDPVRLSGSELTPDDIGKPVSVVAETRDTAHPTHYSRDVTHPLRWLGYVLVVVAVVVLIGFGGSALLRLFPQEIRLDVDKKLAAALRARYRSEGRFSTVDRWSY